MADNLQRIRYHHIFLTVSISIVDLWRQRLYHFAKLSLAGKRLSAISKMQHHHFHHNNNEAEKQNPFWRYSNAAHSGFRITKLSRSFRMISSYNCSNIMKLSRLLQNERSFLFLCQHRVHCHHGAYLEGLLNLACSLAAPKCAPPRGRQRG